MRALPPVEGRRKMPSPWRWGLATLLVFLSGLVLWSTVEFSGLTGAAVPISNSMSPPGSKVPLISMGPDAATPPISASPAASVSLSPASATVSPAAALTGTAPAANTGGVATTQATATPSPTFTPISVQAEASGNTLTDGAAVVSCDTCDGGARVQYVFLGRKVIVYATANIAGNRTVTVTYETSGPRTLKVSINGGAVNSFDVDGTSWVTPLRLSFTAAIPAGSISVTLTNDDGYAPDVDKVTIT
jgi:hypothetical protein